MGCTHLGRGVTAALLVSLLSQIANSQAESSPANTGQYEESVRNLIAELQSLPADEISSLDRAWQLNEIISFSMAYLLTPRELPNVLTHLQTNDSSPWNELVLATFRTNYADARIPRRVGLSKADGPRTQLRDLSASSRTCIRATALATLCVSSRSTDTEYPISRDQVDWFNALVSMSPQSEVTRISSLKLLITHLSPTQQDINSLPSFMESYAWSMTSLRTMRESVQPFVVINGLKIEPTAEYLQGSVWLNSGPELGAMIAELLAVIGNPTDFEGQQRTAESSYVGMLAYLHRGDPLRAYRLLAPASRCEIPRRYFALRIHELAMALTRGGYEREAIDAFQLLAETYPGSQLAAFAEGHIRHLNQFTGDAD